MKVLAIDSSGLVASVAVVTDDDLISEYTINYKKTHSQTLLPMMEEMNKTIELDINSIDAIAVAAGPGSFTGLRIGAATAKGMALALNKPIISIPTLDGLAYNIYNNNAIICPILDARRNQVYTALYNYKKYKLNRISDYLAINIDELIELLNEYNSEVVFLGDGVTSFGNTIKEKFRMNYYFAPNNLNRQRAGSIGALAVNYKDIYKMQSATEFVPFYLRQSQAEREYKEKELRNVDNKRNDN